MNKPPALGNLPQWTRPLRLGEAFLAPGYPGDARLIKMIVFAIPCSSYLELATCVNSLHKKRGCLLGHPLL